MSESVLNSIYGTSRPAAEGAIFFGIGMGTDKEQVR